MPRRLRYDAWREVRPTARNIDPAASDRLGVLVAPNSTGLRVRVGGSDRSAGLPRDVAGSPAGTRMRVLEGVDRTTQVARPLTGPFAADQGAPRRQGP